MMITSFSDILCLTILPSSNCFILFLGFGYAELLSYCTCDEETNTPFALCDKRSDICSRKQGKDVTFDTFKLGKMTLLNSSLKDECIRVEMGGVRFVSI